MRLLRALSNVILNVSRDGAATISLGNVSMFYQPHCIRLLPYISFKSTLWEFKTITTCPIKLLFCFRSELAASDSSS